MTFVPSYAPSGKDWMRQVSRETNAMGDTVESLDRPNGRERVVNTGALPAASKAGENLHYYNAGTTGHYSIRFASLVKTGNLGDGSNDIGDTLICRYDNITNGFAWGRWDVMQSPLNPASGLTGAPSGAQGFAMVLGEGNPQNRHGDPAWAGESRRFNNWVGGYQMVPETQDFTSLLPAGTRRGYRIAFGLLLARSPYTNSDQQRHATYLNGILINPNAVAPGGAGIFATGYREHITAVAVSAGGGGYAVGNLLTFNTGLGQDANENTIVRVTAVNGSGAVTAAEVYNAGWYNQPFASPVGVTGGSGTGATFTYTPSSGTDAPRAWAGVAGSWGYAIDAAIWQGASSYTGGALFSGAMFRAPNNQTIINARNAADNADISVLKVNASDQVEVGQAANALHLLGNRIKLGTLPGNYANDAAAAAGGVGLNEVYRNGSALMVRVA